PHRLDRDYRGNPEADGGLFRPQVALPRARQGRERTGKCLRGPGLRRLADSPSSLGSARIIEVRWPPSGAGTAEACPCTCARWPWPDRRGGCRSGRWQISPVSRIQIDLAERYFRDGSLFRLSRTRLRIPASHRVAEELFPYQRSGRRTYAA